MPKNSNVAISQTTYIIAKIPESYWICLESERVKQPLDLGHQTIPARRRSQGMGTQLRLQQAYKQIITSTT